MQTDMKLHLNVCTIFLLFNCACQQSHTKSSFVKKDTTNMHTIKTDTAKQVSYWDEVQNSIPKDLKPVFGYRFIIKGDFDGDGNKETLTEHFFSSRDKSETNKFYKDLNYDQLVMLTVDKAPYSFISCSNEKIDTLSINANTSQLLGLSFFKNEGDLNGDGADEVSYVVDWAGWSSLNTCHLLTYKNGKWKELLRIPIWDWQLPPRPSSVTEYGYFGIQERMAIADNDSLNKTLLSNLSRFPGFIREIGKNKIQVVFRNKEADEDTLIMDIRHPIDLE